MQLSNNFSQSITSLSHNNKESLMSSEDKLNCYVNT